MSPPRALARDLLAPAEEILDSVAGRNHFKRLEVLEAAASALGGCSLETLRKTDQQPRTLTIDEALFGGDLVRVALLSGSIHPALALAYLAQPPLGQTDRRRAGAYYTDFRLARFLTERLPRQLQPTDMVLDPASGTGVLLVATALRFAADRRQLDRFITTSVSAADLSATALRGAKLALASLTADDAAIEALARRLRRLDSLEAGPAAWEDIAPRGFRLVIGNPPWERLKLSRHEHLAAKGVERHYGADYGGADFETLGDARARMRAYVDDMRAIYGREGRGESDLYRLFLSLAMRLAGSEGGEQIAMLVPAGLIRSQGTESLRRDLLSCSSLLRLAVLENKPRFFGIDTRFKFLALHAVLGEDRRRSMLVLDHADADAERVSVTSSARLGRSELERLRPDLTVPEVRTNAEWALYRRMARSGGPLGARQAEWPLDLTRELDMTNDRELLQREERAGALPLIEGRMIHQFRSGHKAYVSGSGRSAIWRVVNFGEHRLDPQFWVSPEHLNAKLRDRAGLARIGFCDITGQTNERTMLAARIPAGAICGNKVPTITFAAHPTPMLAAQLWLAVVNSFAFDWLLRRVVTTTVNYFVLRSVPFPSLSIGSHSARRLTDLVCSVEMATQRDPDMDPLGLANRRAEIDALVLQAYGLTLEDAQLVLGDFPLLDRDQPPLPGEQRSTVTRDLVLDTFAKLEGERSAESHQRLLAARSYGADAYIPPRFGLPRPSAAAIPMG